MKNIDKKTGCKDSLTEALLEVALGCVLLAIGFGIACLFGADMPLLETDPEIFILIGIGFLAFVFFVFYFIRRLVNKKSAVKNGEDADTEKECCTDGECDTEKE